MVVIVGIVVFVVIVVIVVIVLVMLWSDGHYAHCFGHCGLGGCVHDGRCASGRHGVSQFI